MEQLEIEFKILLTKEMYQKIKNDFKNQIKETYSQTNYYLMHPILDQLQYSLRIRKKKNSYELTLKRPSSSGLKEMNIQIDETIKNKIFHHQPVDNEIFTILKDINIAYQDLNCQHYLKTIRSDIELKEGILSLDDNEYNGVKDYEMELEVLNKEEGYQKWLSILKHYHLSYKKNCDSKIKRMKMTLK